MNPTSPPAIKIPQDEDGDSPLSLFSLFLPDSIWHKVIQNTNCYANWQWVWGPSHKCERAWYPTTFSEIMVFIGAIIHMGVYKEPQISHYWCTNLWQGLLHTIPLHMGLKCYEQLWHYLHISYIKVVDIPPYTLLNKEPTPYNEVTMDMDHLGDVWWYKLELILSTFWVQSKWYYIPSSKVSIDETMIKCFRCSIYTYKMLNKPITQVRFPFLLYT